MYLLRLWSRKLIIHRICIINVGLSPCLDISLVMCFDSITFIPICNIYLFYSSVAKYSNTAIIRKITRQKVM